MPRDTLIQIRRDTLSNWATTNPILASGEPGLETTTNRTKIGDGTTAWNDLGYQNMPFYGSFYSTDTVAAANTTSSFYLGTNFVTTSGVTPNGISITGGSNNLITFTYAGVYKLQLSAQFQNTASTEADVQIWLEKNSVGGNVSQSTRLVSIPKSHGTSDPTRYGHTVVSFDYILSVDAGDWFRLLWASNTGSSAVSVEYYGAGSSPTTPGNPSVRINVTQIA